MGRQWYSFQYQYMWNDDWVALGCGFPLSTPVCSHRYIRGNGKINNKTECGKDEAP